MKKSYYLLGFLPLFYSCSEIEDLPNVESSVSNTSYTPSPAALVVTFDTEDSTFGKFSISEQE